MRIVHCCWFLVVLLVHSMKGNSQENSPPRGILGAVKNALEPREQTFQVHGSTDEERKINELIVWGYLLESSKRETGEDNVLRTPNSKAINRSKTLFNSLDKRAQIQFLLNPTKKAPVRGIPRTVEVHMKRPSLSESMGENLLAALENVMSTLPLSESMRNGSRDSRLSYEPITAEHRRFISNFNDMRVLQRSIIEGIQNKTCESESSVNESLKLGERTKNNLETIEEYQNRYKRLSQEHKRLFLNLHNSIPDSTENYRLASVKDSLLEEYVGQFEKEMEILIKHYEELECRVLSPTGNARNAQPFKQNDSVPSPIEPSGGSGGVKTDER